MLRLGNLFGERSDKNDAAVGGNDVSHGACYDRKQCAAHAQDYHGTNERDSGLLRTGADPCGSREGNAQQYTDPPGCDDSPDEAEQRWIIRRDDAGMTDREVLDADSRRDLIVDDAVGNARQDRENDDCQPLHDRNIRKEISVASHSYGELA